MRKIQRCLFFAAISYPWKGQPLSVIETMAYYLLVISCSHKGIPELTEDRNSEFLVALIFLWHNNEMPRRSYLDIFQKSSGSNPKVKE